MTVVASQARSTVGDLSELKRRSTQRNARTGQRPIVGSTDPVHVELDALEVGPSLRQGGLNDAHVQALAEVPEDWPPILIARRGRWVIDGRHRVAAAQQLHMKRIAAVLFNGDLEEAFVEFVRRNTSHGLPLSLLERQRAGLRLLESHPNWSDRRIGQICALDPKTVAKLRTSSRDTDCPTSGTPQLDERRIGRDGRSRPVDRQRVRRELEDAIRTQPDASLRTIAHAVGVSPETVRTVRMQLRSLNISEGETDHQDASHSLGADHRSGNCHFDASERSALEPVEWTRDQAFASTEERVQFAEWFDQQNVNSQCEAYVDSVPLSRVYEIADEARRRSRFWEHFADLVEARARPSGRRVSSTAAR